MTTSLKAPRVILADNASPLTGRGTNTFLLGESQIGIIDPGPDLPQHRQAILQAVGKGKVTHILITHAHLDHSEGARALAEACGAPILAYGEATAGRSAVMARLAASGQLRGGEGLDMAFRPDQIIAELAAHKAAHPDFNIETVHFFPLGGIGAAANWAAATCDTASATPIEPRG